jgi:hypothetical protein
VLVISIVTALLVLLAVDRCAGLLMGVEGDFVFDPCSIVSYSTPEFHPRLRSTI